MVLISTVIEIAAHPERVRAIFLDFPKLPEWSSLLKSIESPKNPIDLVPGDKIKIDFGGMKSEAPVLENSPQLFKWRGSLPLNLINGDHSFCFEPSKLTPGSTTFTNSEEFTGLLSFLAKTSSAKTMEANFAKFNEDLKRRAESDA